MNKPKVLVGCPTSDYHKYCLSDYKESVKNLSYNNYSVVLVDNSYDKDYYKNLEDSQTRVIKCTYSESARDRIVRSRNILRDIALNENYDYFLSLEQDVIPPNDVIEKLLRHKKDIVSGVYFGQYTRGNQKRLLPMLWVAKKDDPTKIRYVPLALNYVNSGDFFKVDLSGLGCILISRKVLENINFKYNSGLKKQFDDISFCIDARNKGFEIYADTSVKCKHLILNRPWSWKELLE